MWSDLKFHKYLILAFVNSLMVYLASFYWVPIGYRRLTKMTNQLVFVKIVRFKISYRKVGHMTKAIT